MTAHERLFAFEIEFQRRLRQCPAAVDDPSDLHTSWAMGMGYEALIDQTGPVTAHDVLRIAQRMMTVGDPRDVLAARDSVMQLLGITQFV